MSKKSILLLAAALILLGAILFGGAMTMLKWDFKRLSTVCYETNIYTVSEPFLDVAVKGDTARIVLVPSENGEVTVTCYERTKAKHAVSVTDGVLTVGIEDERKWYERIGIDLDHACITLALPAREYETLTLKVKTGDITVPRDFSFADASLQTSTGDVEISASVAGMLSVKTSTGSVKLSGLSAGGLSLSSSTGSISLSSVRVSGDVSITSSTGKTSLADLTCRNLTVKGRTGELTLDRTLVDGEMTLTQNTGSIRLSLCDADRLTVKTSTGSVIGTLLTGKQFDAKSNTGRVSVPASEGSGACYIRTNTGRIRIELATEE